MSRDLTAERFRASSHYRLVPLHELRESTRQALGALAREPGLYGLLEPCGGVGRGLQAVSIETAELIHACETPGPLPSRLLERLGEGASLVLARLVLDDVIELCLDGVFVSGTRAAPRLLGRVEPLAAEGRIATLSLSALRHAEALGSRDPLETSNSLYRFNTRPASPQWWKRLPDAQAVASFLQVDRFGASAALLALGEVDERDAGARDAWHSWHAGSDQREMTYKLYVSPEPAHVGTAFRAVSGVIGDEGRAFAVKVGRDLYGLLRPDKLVVYFYHLDDLQETAHRLRRELEGTPAQGVPFTAGLNADGLLSWGVDPPAVGASPAWIGTESWRLWVTHRLAAAIVAAQTERRADVPPWWYAIKRIELEGIDPTTWAPRLEWSGGRQGSC